MCQKCLSKATKKDLEAIAHFHKVVKNYIKMKKLYDEHTRTHSEAVRGSGDSPVRVERVLGIKGKDL